MSGDPQIPEGSRAILIGVPRYRDVEYRSYTAVGNSVDGMYQLLVESGLCGWRKEQVTKIVDPFNAGQLTGRLRELAQKTTGVLLLYFVGHGEPSEHTGELCLAIADTDHAHPDATGLEYAKIKRMLHSGTPAATKIAILDCCYAGRAIGLGADNEGMQLAELSHCAGAYTLTAADERAHVPPDGRGRPRTAFTSELLDLLSRDGVPDGPPSLTLGVIFPRLQQRLAAKGLPRPNQRSDDTAAAFVFARNRATLLAGHDVPAAPATTASSPGEPPRHDAGRPQAPYVKHVARNIAAEPGGDLASVEGGRLDRRIHKQDVVAAASSNKAYTEHVDQSDAGSSEWSWLGIFAALLLLGAVIAGFVFLPKILRSTPPSDAPALSSAHVGDCAATNDGKPLDVTLKTEYSYKKVPCWYRSAAFRVLKIGKPDHKVNVLGSVEDRQFCQGVAGWDAGDAVEVGGSLDEKLVYCLAHK